MTKEEALVKRVQQHVGTALTEARGESENSKSGHIWIGFSGGLDSTVLVHCLASLRSTRAIHVNHGISKNSKSWEEHCQNICLSLDVPIVIERVTISEVGNLEANARDARYKAFAKHVGDHDVLATAHHTDDVLETILLKLFQGRALDGLSKHNLIDGMRVVRPLLDLRRSELEAYAHANQLSWIEDESNADVRFDRNFLRAEILPSLLARWPDLDKRIGRVVGAAIGQRTALEHEVLKYVDEGLFVRDLPDDEEAAVALLRAYLELMQQFQVTDVALSEFLSQVGAGQNAKVLWRGGGLQLKGEKICVLNRAGD